MIAGAVCALGSGPLAAQLACSRGDTYVNRNTPWNVGATAALSAAGTHMTGSRVKGFAAAVAVGALKEAWDFRRPGHCASYKDFSGYVIGAAIGVVIGRFALQAEGRRAARMSYSASF